MPARINVFARLGEFDLYACREFLKNQNLEVHDLECKENEERDCIEWTFSAPVATVDELRYEINNIILNAIAVFAF